ncbi:MAG: alanine:cation symporter family protein [Calditrichaeota bacterium]|nr:alanine:cation symporter family protein [Calditrichota bacterium]
MNNSTPSLFATLENIIVAAASWIWGLPLLFLLMGGGLFFMFLSRFLPFRYLGHALNILRGKYDNPDDPGEINHFEALSTALAATIGMGNISGVAVAITIGGPGAIFWMWISAFVGMATKFFTCTLAVLYRGKDSQGRIQGGPMYVIMEGLGQKWKPLAVFFCVAALLGCLPIFNANQLTQAVRDILLVPNGVPVGHFSNFATGLGLCLVTGTVVLGGLDRIAKAAGRLVPTMVLIYFGAVMVILVMHFQEIPHYINLIFSDAFTARFYRGDSILGGALGGLIVQGARRAAFSNEAGIGTAPMAHGAAKTSEPVREGLVAMMGPAIDTLIVCSLTALAILFTGVWSSTEANGVTLTANAFGEAFPGFGQYILLLCILIFGMTSLFSYSYFGSKCLSFLIGADKKFYYNYFYIASIMLGAMSSLNAIINLIDFSYALMAIPTMLSALLLAPRVMKVSRDYFARMAGEI